MSCIPSERENPHGLHQRYIVAKASGEPVDPMATYFVLRLDQFGDDQLHVDACRAAARAYAKHVKTYRIEHLARVDEDLCALVENLEACG